MHIKLLLKSMSTSPIFNFYKLLPRKSEFLDRRIGGIGEVFYDQDAQSLRLYDGRTSAGISIVSENNLTEKLVAENSATVIYTVTISGPTNPDVGNKYNFNGVYKPTLNLIMGYTYVFNQSDLTNVYFPNANGTTLNPHPLQFSSDDPNGELADGTTFNQEVIYRLNDVTVTKEKYTGVSFNTATKREVWITITSSTPSPLYYYCANHLNMGSSITTTEPGAGGSSGNVTVSVGASVPAGPVNGSLWLNTNNGSLYVYVTDTDGSQWIQPAVPYPIQPEEEPQIILPDPFVFSVAADDSTQRTISSGNLIKFIGAGGVTTASDADGTITITGGGTTGNVTFSTTTIDSTDSSAITFTPAVVMQSDLTVENDLIVGNLLTVSNLLLTGNLTTQGSGTPEIVSDNEIELDAGTRVDVIRGPIRMARFTSADRDLLTAQNGDMIYNTTTNKFQGRAGGSWVDLH
jgi:hypothetical protein